MPLGGNNSIGGVSDMKNEKQTRFRMFAIGCCLCLLAAGAGVAYRGMLNAPAEQMEMHQPVTAVQTPALDTAIFERNKQSSDGGESPDGEEKEQKEPKEKKEQNVPQEQKGEPKKAEPKAAEQKKETQTEPARAPVFSYPVEGRVVLPYSADHAIYDPTLDQYRTNDSISLAAAEGTAVRAAADGMVEAVLTDTEAGNMVVIAHGEDWLTTYGQLTVSVKEGDRVKQGQTIGQVTAPTKYGAALGSHLEFAMEKEGRPVDPAKAIGQE